MRKSRFIDKRKGFQSRLTIFAPFWIWLTKIYRCEPLHGYKLVILRFFTKKSPHTALGTTLR